MAEPESTADKPAFSTEFRERLATGKYTKWAVDLTENQLNVVLWAAGEFGRRCPDLPSCIDPHSGRFNPSDARARAGLELLTAAVHGHPLSMDEYFPAFWARVRQLADQYHTKQNPNPESADSNDLLRGIVAGTDAAGSRGHWNRGAVKVLIALGWASAIALLIVGVYFIGRLVLAADPRDLAIVTKICGLCAVIFCLLALNPRDS